MIYLFDESKRLTGIIAKEHVRTIRFSRERNSLYDIVAEIPVINYHQGERYNLHSKTKDAVFLGHYDLEDRFQLHKISLYDVDKGMIRIQAVHLFFDEAKAGAIIRERRYIDREVSDGARDAFAEIGWQLADYDVSPKRTYNFYNVSPLEARATLIETFGYEFDYWLDFDGKKISGKYFSVKRRIGEDSNKRYTYDKHTNTGHHVLSLRAEQDYSELYTAVIGRGRGEEYEDTGGYGRRIEFTDIAWSKPNNPLDKPRGSRVLVDPEATQAFGYVDGDTVKPRTAVVVFSDIEEPRELIEASYDWLVEHRQPKLLFDVKVADGDGLNLGDTVHIKYNEIGLNLAVRVGKVTEDLKTGERHVELGDVEYFSPGRSNREIKRSMAQDRRDAANRIFQLKQEFDENFDNRVNQMRDDFEQALIDANAEIQAAEQRMTTLIESERDTMTEEFNENVQEARKYAEQQAKAKADAVQGNLESFEQTHQQLYDSVTSDIMDIDTFIGDKTQTLAQQFAEVESDFSGLQTELNGVSEDLGATKTDLQQQIDDADSSIVAAGDKIEAVEGRITDAEGKLVTNDQNIADAQERLTQAEQDISEHGTDIGTVKQTLTNIDGELASKVERTEYDALEGSVTSHGTRISQNETDISSKAEQTEVDTISGTVSDHSTQISQNATDIKSKADSTTVDSIDETVTSHSTLISQNATDIQSKADTSVVDSLAGTVENNSTEISQNAQRIESKAEQSIVDTLSGTVSDHESRITQNAKGIESKVSSEELRMEIDSIEVGGRNLIKESDTMYTWTGERNVTTDSGAFVYTKSPHYPAMYQIEVRAIDDSIVGAEFGWQWSSRLQGNTVVISNEWERATAYLEESANIGLRVSGGVGAIELRHIKAEKGNKATDWTPAPEDTEAKITDINTILTSHDTIITQTAEAITSKADKSVVDALSGTVGEHSTTIMQTAEEMNRKAESSVVDAIRETVVDHTLSITETAKDVSTLIEKTELHDGDIAQWSNETKANAESISQTLIRVEETEDGIRQAQTDIQTNADGIAGVIRDVETIDGELSTLSTDFNVEAGKIESLISKTDGHDSQLTDLSIDVDGFKATVSELEGDMLSGFANVDMRFDSITNTVANIKLNTRNMLAGTLFDNPDLYTDMGGTRKVTYSGGETVIRIEDIGMNTSSLMFSNSVKLEAGTDYYFVVEYRSFSTPELDYLQLQLENGSYQTLYDADTGKEGLTSLTDDGNWRESTIRINSNTDLEGQLRMGTRWNRGSAGVWIDIMRPYLTNTLNREWVPHPNDGQSIDEVVDRVSEVEQTAEQIRSTVYDSTGLATIIAQSPSALDIIAKNLNLTGNLNVKGQIESISMDAIEGNFARLWAAEFSAITIDADDIQGFTARFEYLYTLNANIERLVSQTAFINEINTLSLNAVYGDISDLRTELLTSNVILSRHVNSSMALIDKIFSEEAYIERLTSKSAFIRDIQAIEITANQLNLNTLTNRINQIEGGLRIRRPDGVDWVRNGQARGHVPIQVFDSYASSSVDYSGFNFVTSSSFWQTFKYFYTPHEGSRLKITWAVGLQPGNSASEEIEVRVRGFGNYTPINHGTGTSNRTVMVRAGETEYITQEVGMPPPNFNTFQAYLEFRRTPGGTNSNNRVTARILHIGQYD